MRNWVISRLWVGKEFLIFNGHREEYFGQFLLNLNDRVVLCRLAPKAIGMELGLWHMGWNQGTLGLDEGSSGAEDQAKRWAACHKAELQSTRKSFKTPLILKACYCLLFCGSMESFLIMKSLHFLEVDQDLDLAVL